MHMCVYIYIYIKFFLISKAVEYSWVELGGGDDTAVKYFVIKLNLPKMNLEVGKPGVKKKKSDTISRE